MVSSMANSYKEVRKEAAKENQVLLKAKTLMRGNTREMDDRLSQFSAPSQDTGAREGGSGFHLRPPLEKESQEPLGDPRA